VVTPASNRWTLPRNGCGKEWKSPEGLAALLGELAERALSWRHPVAASQAELEVIQTWRARLRRDSSAATAPELSPIESKSRW